MSTRSYDNAQSVKTCPPVNRRPVSIKPSTYVDEPLQEPVQDRDLPQELRTYVVPGVLRNVAPRPKAWAFPEMARHGVETIAATWTPRMKFGAVLSFVVTAGARLLLGLPDMDRVRVAHDAVLEAHAEDLLIWFDNFDFRPSAGKSDHQDISLSPKELEPLTAIVWKIRLPQSQAVTLAAMAALIEFATVDPRARQTMRDELKRFAVTLHERAATAEQFAALAVERTAPPAIVTSFDEVLEAGR